LAKLKFNVLVKNLQLSGKDEMMMGGERVRLDMPRTRISRKGRSVDWLCAAAADATFFAAALCRQFLIMIICLLFCALLPMV